VPRSGSAVAFAGMARWRVSPAAPAADCDPPGRTACPASLHVLVIGTALPASGPADEGGMDQANRGAGGRGRTQAVFYRDPSGREPVNVFLDALPPAAQQTIDDQIDLLNGLPAGAPPLAFPHSSQVRGPLRELRCHYGRTLYRILYRRSASFLLLLHAIEKRTGRIPQSDIAIAAERFTDFRRRMDAVRRSGPRAAGHDAPPKRQRARH
jgi:phage-related protein